MNPDSNTICKWSWWLESSKCILFIVLLLQGPRNRWGRWARAPPNFRSLLNNFWEKLHLQRGKKRVPHLKKCHSAVPAISWHTAKCLSSGPVLIYIICTYEIHTSNMPDQQKFAEFYSSIRLHFSANIWDYDKFKNSKDNRSKVEFLMSHEASALKSEKSAI